MAYGRITQQELIELVRSHHPHMLEEEVRRALNRAQAEFCAETEIIESLYADTIVDGQSFYRLGSSAIQGDHPIITIKRVDINEEVIPRLKGSPPLLDKDIIAT
tara:strand:+ start:10726 stop:11037 length:312 start_codon:yes stop_codon:yes gene_type:complete